jgi:release factor glutamine methyltransferase
MIRTALSQASARIGAVSDSARLDAELLLAHLLGCSRAQLRSRDDTALPPSTLAEFERLVERRCDGEPVAYLLGYRDFWKSRFRVGPGVLVPRPETELLVETALEWLSDLERPRVLDLGTGSGAIGLSIALERPDAEVVLVDRSPVALAMAETNRALLGVAARMVSGSWFAALGQQERYDLILANPPYVAPEDRHLSGPELRHEPLEALVAAGDGLADLQTLAAQSPQFLRPYGKVLLEHGCDQGAAVRSALERAGFRQVRTFLDLSALERATGGGLGD